MCALKSVASVRLFVTNVLTFSAISFLALLHEDQWSGGKLRSPVFEERNVGAQILTRRGRNGSIMKFSVIFSVKYN